MAEHEVIERILSEAQQEAERIVEASRSNVEDRRTLLESKIERIRREGEEEAKAAERRIAERTGQAIRMVERKQRLALEQEICRITSERVRCRFAELIGTDGYRDILSGWIAEGAMALGTSSATVQSSDAERKDVRAALKQAAETVKELAGETVELTLAAETLQNEHGVVLTSPDGRRRYDSRISARLSRNEQLIRSAVHHRFFDSGDRHG